MHPQPYALYIHYIIYTLYIHHSRHMLCACIVYALQHVGLSRVQDGDILNIDVTVYLNGYHGDTSRTFLVGNVDEEARELVAVTEEALARAIAICGPGVPIKQIGATIHAFADTYGYGVVPNFVGHGVGWDFHSAPTISHCRNNVQGVMEPGMTFTIEPMLTLGGNTREKAWKCAFRARSAVPSVSCLSCA